MNVIENSELLFHCSLPFRVIKCILMYMTKSKAKILQESNKKIDLGIPTFVGNWLYQSTVKQKLVLNFNSPGK
jgi:hypothetical protein